MLSEFFWMPHLLSVSGRKIDRASKLELTRRLFHEYNPPIRTRILVEASNVTL